MTIVAKAPIREAFKAAFKVDPAHSLEQCIEQAVATVAKQLRLPEELVREAVEDGEPS